MGLGAGLEPAQSLPMKLRSPYQYVDRARCSRLSQANCYLVLLLQQMINLAHNRAGHVDLKES